jgi:hypothetical protein
VFVGRLVPFALAGVFGPLKGKAFGGHQAAQVIFAKRHPGGFLQLLP